MKKILVLFAVLIIGTQLFAYNFEKDGIYYDINSDGTTVSVTYNYNNGDYDSYSGDITIPSSVTYDETTYSVTAIGGAAFGLCIGLTNVTIPNSITAIGQQAFYGCTGLTSITIPNSVTTIGAGAFYYCTGLTSITIPSSVTTIGAGAFYYCTGLTSITIPSSVTTIGADVFHGCTGLTSITIPSSVTSIGEAVFAGCTNLTNISVNSANPCYTVADGILYNKVQDTIFACLVGKSGNVTIPNSVVVIGSYAFYCCKGLTNVTIGNGVTSIRYYAFAGCSGLTSIIIPNSVDTIDTQAFYYCTGLTSVTIGSGVKTIGDYAFAKCDALDTVISLAVTPPSLGNQVFDSKALNGFISVPTEGFCDYLEAEGWSEFSNLNVFKKDNMNYKIINDSDVSVAKGNYTGDIVIPASITLDCNNKAYNVSEIDNQAFFNCTGLTSIEIPNSITTIPDSCFYNAESLKVVKINNSVTKIGMYAFANCFAIDTIYSYAQNPPTIYKSTFEEVPNTAEVIVPCNTKETYSKKAWWNLFVNIKELCEGSIVDDNPTNKDTVYIHDTITVTLTDTVYIHDTITTTLTDTIYIHDTVIPCAEVRTYIYAKINNGETYEDFGFSESEAGKYSKTLQTEDGCDSTVILYLSFTAGIDDITETKVISIYPNPAKDVVVIENVVFNTEHITINVYDTQGKLVLSETKPNATSYTLNTASLQSGVYYINIGNITQKLIIQ